MKKILLALIIFSSCEKPEETVSPTQTYITGEWLIYPAGNMQDSFFYQIKSNIEIANIGWIGGRVTGNPIVIPTVSNGIYTIFYRDTFPQDYHTYKSHAANFVNANFIDSVPATIY